MYRLMFLDCLLPKYDSMSVYCCMLRPVETPDQRKARKQAEADRAHAQVQSLSGLSKFGPVKDKADLTCAAGLLQKYADSQAQVHNTEQNQNFLKRETPFLCNVRFRCDLPEVSFTAIIPRHVSPLVCW